MYFVCAVRRADVIVVRRGAAVCFGPKSDISMVSNGIRPEPVNIRSVSVLYVSSTAGLAMGTHGRARVSGHIWKPYFEGK